MTAGRTHTMTSHMRAMTQSIAGVPLVFYGYLFQRVMVTLYGIPLVEVSLGSRSSVPDIISFVSVLLVAFAAAMLSARKTRRILFVCGTGFQLASVALLAAALAAPEHSASLVEASLIMQGLGGMATSALWVDAWASQNPIKVAFLNAMTMLATAALVFAFESNDFSRLFPIMIALILVTGACYLASAKRMSLLGSLSSKDEVDQSERELADTLPPSKSQLIVPTRALVFIGAYTFAYGVASSTLHPMGIHYASIFPAVLSILIILFSRKNSGISSLFRIALPLCVTGFLLVAFIPSLLHPFSDFVLDAGYVTVRMMLLLMVCTIAYSSNASALWLFGIMTAVQFCANQLGTMLATFITTAFGSSAYLILSCIAITLVVVASIALMSENSLFSLWSPGSRSDKGESDADCSLKARVTSLSSTHLLTDRETEMLHLLVSGKTNAQMAQDLFISENTVRAHLHHVYQKFGVHTRKELMDLVVGKQKGSH